MALCYVYTTTSHFSVEIIKLERLYFLSKKCKIALITFYKYVVVDATALNVN